MTTQFKPKELEMDGLDGCHQCSLPLNQNNSFLKKSSKLEKCQNKNDINNYKEQHHQLQVSALASEVRVPALSGAVCFSQHPDTDRLVGQERSVGLQFFGKF